MKSRVVALLTLLILVVGCEPQSGVRPLKRGVNLSHWFSQTRLPDYPPNAATAEEMQLIRSLGMDHVRLPVDPIRLWDFSKEATMDAAVLGEVDAAIELAMEHGLSVVVDMHPRPHVKDRLENDPAAFESFVKFWGRLAGHLSKYDAEGLALEILNEPLVQDGKRWQAMANELYAAIRQAAPKHTIIIGGAEWSDVFMLRNLEPLDDPNVIYTFHFYEPHMFTHQGARWGSPEWLVYTNVPYPMPPQVGSNMVAGVTNEAIREAMFVHIEQDWDANKIDDRIKLAADWAAAHGVAVWCGEFGAYRPYMAAEDRARYIRDVRTMLERYDIGWTLWDLKGSFSLLEKGRKKPRVDRRIADALGLSVVEEAK
jgi:aryl-phospho-beta-D-glucosidase BglC (GH1 family)